MPSPSAAAPGTIDTWAASAGTPSLVPLTAKRRNSRSVMTSTDGSEVIVVEKCTDDDCVGVHQRSEWDGDLQRSVPQRGPALHLNGYPMLVVKTMHKRINAAIEQR